MVLTHLSLHGNASTLLTRSLIAGALDPVYLQNIPNLLVESLPWWTLNNFPAHTYLIARRLKKLILFYQSFLIHHFCMSEPSMKL